MSFLLFFAILMSLFGAAEGRYPKPSVLLYVEFHQYKNCENIF